MAASANLTEGEIREPDMVAQKITIKHGIVNNLVMLDKAMAGDTVRFQAKKTTGAIWVTDIASPTRHHSEKNKKQLETKKHEYLTSEQKACNRISVFYGFDKLSAGY